MAVLLPQDENPDVRASALTALSQMGEAGAGHVDKVAEALKDWRNLEELSLVCASANSHVCSMLSCSSARMLLFRAWSDLSCS